MRSMQDEELSKTYVDSIEIWWSPYFKVTNSMLCGCFIINISVFRWYFEVSPNTAIKCEMHSASVWKLSELL